MKRQIPSSYNPAQAAKLLNYKESARDRQREKRIEEIVEVAVELFSKEGTAGFSMRRVASLAGVTLSLYRHAPSHRTRCEPAASGTISCAYR
jgi:predicted HTH domain antitoxin